MRAIVIAGLLAGAGSVAAHDRSITRERLVETVERIEAHQAALSQIWPGYWPEGQAFVLYEAETGAAFGGAAAAVRGRFEPGAREDVLRGFILDYASGAPNTVLVNVSGALDREVEILFHEQFHDFQWDGFERQVAGSSEFVDLTLLPDTLAFAAAAELERRVLAQALQARSGDERRQLAALYLGLRRDRQVGLDVQFVDAEANRERIEGTAQYVGVQATAIVDDRSAGWVRERIAERLASNLWIPGSGYGSVMFRSRAYGVGAGLSLLLDDLALDGWRQQVMHGTALHVVLARSVEPADETTTQAARASYRLTDIASSLAEPVQQSLPPFATAEQFLARASARLVVEFQIPLDARSEFHSGFTARSLVELAPGVTAFLQMPLLESTWREARLRVSQRDVLIELPSSRRSAGTHLANRYTILLDDLTGLDTLPEGDAPDGLAIEVEGILLSLPGDAEIQRNEGEIVIRYRPQDDS